MRFHPVVSLGFRPLAGALLLAPLSFGCSSGLEGVEKRLSSMQDEITRLQNQNDRLVERVDAMEARATARPPAAQTPRAAEVSERPSLRVVKVVPDDPAGMPSPRIEPLPPSEAADDPSPRPVIKLRGKGSEKGTEG